MAISPLIPLILLATILGSGVAIFVWVFRDTPGAKPLSAFMIGASVLALAQGMALATPTLTGKTFWSSVAATASPIMPLAWVAIVFAYAESERSWNRWLVLAFLVEPVVFVALVWTNADHGLVWANRWIESAGGSDYLAQEFSLGMWAHAGYSYLLISAGALELVRTNFETSEFFRTQGTALLGAIFVPVGLGMLSMYGTIPEQYDLSGLGFVFAGLVMTATLFRGQLLSVTPATRQLGREAVIDEMDDRIVILDDDDLIVDVNPAAARLLDVDPDSVVGLPLDDVASKLAATIDSVQSGQAELELDGADGRHFYDVRVSQLFRSYGGIAGRVVSFRDVTERRQHEQRLDVLNRVLRHNLRNELNIVRGNAELLRRDVDTSDDGVIERLDRIEETVDTVSSRSEKIGQISRRLESLAVTIESRYPPATVAVEAPEGVSVVGGSSLERAFEELLENAAEHGGDTPTIRVGASRCEGPYVEIRIVDDGPGIDRQERVVIEEGRETALEHGSGVGLWLVNWVVRECGGSVEFASTDYGTCIVVTLPDADADIGSQIEDQTDGPGPLTSSSKPDWNHGRDDGDGSREDGETAPNNEADGSGAVEEPDDDANESDNAEAEDAEEDGDDGDGRSTLEADD